MIIQYKNNKIRKICTSSSEATKVLGQTGSEKLRIRLVQLESFALEVLLRDRIGGCHKLKGNRDGQFAMKLNEPFRLIFIVKKINTATIVEIVDYH